MAHVAEPSPAVDLASLPPEGPPTAAQATAPVLDLEPGASALHFPPTEVQYDGRTTEEKALGPPPMTIYQVDIESLPEKPWRRPGANLSDWFNYGFDEQTWAKWCAKKLSMDQTRQDLQADSGEVPFAPDTGVSGGAHGAQDDAMAQFSAMFGPGAMMGMPQWPMMPEGMPPMMPPMPGCPKDPTRCRPRHRLSRLRWTAAMRRTSHGRLRPMEAAACRRSPYHPTARAAASPGAARLRGAAGARDTSRAALRVVPMHTAHLRLDGAAAAAHAPMIARATTITHAIRGIRTVTRRTAQVMRWTTATSRAVTAV